MSDSEFGGAKQGNKSHHVSKNKLKKKNTKPKFSFSDVKKSKRSADSDNEEIEEVAGKAAAVARRGEDKDENEASKAKQRNPKAFALQSYVAAERNFRRYLGARFACCFTATRLTFERFQGPRTSRPSACRCPKWTGRPWSRRPWSWRSSGRPRSASLFS